MARYRRRLCLAVDLRHYSRHTYPEQQDAQYRLRLVVEHALRRARVPRVRAQQQLQGDGQLVVFPAGIDVVRAVPALVLGLRDGLYQANRAPGLFGRLRMRAGVGQGAISRAERGYLGDCVVLVNRLIDSAPVRDALAADTDSDLALAVSEGIYRDVILPQALGLSAGEFRRIDVVLQDKDFASSAWLHVPRSAPARDLGPEQVIWGHSPGRTALREFVVPALGAAHLAATVVSHSGTLREWVLPGSHNGEPATQAATVADDADFEGPDHEHRGEPHHEDGHHEDGHHADLHQSDAYHSDAYGPDDGHHSDPYHPSPYHPHPYHPDPHHADPYHPASGDQQADPFHPQDVGHHHFPDFQDGGH
ncbi:hypothetical protein [Streptomyces sp. NBC_00299]|uniref:hypothetical protein n=1 Tax=Streptomyces sp. NBC_00299 TaxID=2975705 RepID=UPI002E2B3ED7|nr:hypothetical protein [Streptomyces sp. NBC_00299]